MITALARVHNLGAPVDVQAHLSLFLRPSALSFVSVLFPGPNLSYLFLKSTISSRHIIQSHGSARRVDGYLQLIQEPYWINEYDQYSRWIDKTPWRLSYNDVVRSL